MPADFNHVRYRLPKFSPSMYRGLMNTIDTLLGFDSSDKAKFRLHVLNVFYESGWKGVRLAFPKLTRPTLYRWKKIYEDSFKKLDSLLPKSTRPNRTRTMMTPLPIILLIKSLREKYPRLGKAKIKRFIDEFCHVSRVDSVSISTIGKVIKRHRMFYADKPRGKRKSSNSAKTRIKLCPKSSNFQPGYVQLDGFKFYFLQKYYYFLTAVDIVTKQAWVKSVPSPASIYTASFLREIISSARYKIYTIQTDNGSEFAKYFEKAAREADLLHLFSYPRHPKTNGFVERFNWTVQDEFLFSYEDLLLYPEDFQKELTIWLSWYNQKRPHQSLNYMTPINYIQEMEGCLKSM